MRDFRKPTPIARLSTEARVLYSVFCVFMLVGDLTGLWFYLDDDLGVGPAGARGYYLGEAAPEVGARSAVGGPALELPDIELSSPAPLRLQKPAREVMETFHFHLFSVSVCLLILGHIFMMCGLGRRWKIGALGVGSAATLTHLLAPPLIRFASPGFAALMFPSAALMGLSWLGMTVWPLWEMWRPGGRGRGE